MHPESKVLLSAALSVPRRNPPVKHLRLGAPSHGGKSLRSHPRSYHPVKRDRYRTPPTPNASRVVPAQAPSSRTGLRDRRAVHRREHRIADSSGRRARATGRHRLRQARPLGAATAVPCDPCAATGCRSCSPCSASTRRAARRPHAGRERRRRWGRRTRCLRARTSGRPRSRTPRPRVRRTYAIDLREDVPAVVMAGGRRDARVEVAAAVRLPGDGAARVLVPSRR